MITGVCRPHCQTPYSMLMGKASVSGALLLDLDKILAPEGSAEARGLPAWSQPLVLTACANKRAGTVATAVSFEYLGTCDCFPLQGGPSSRNRLTRLYASREKTKAVVGLYTCGK